MGAPDPTPQIDWRRYLLVREALVVFALTAAFPRLAHRLREPGRPGMRGLVIHVTIKTLTFLAVRALIVAFINHVNDARAHAASVLHERLGREPTPEELRAHLSR